ncbi:TadE/TadG family type IV pilus assembly protein [Quadrisphaera sp. INWT6]|uniref:TadE/TadG family type IV pilus assembly protein n=1 Tax=Quadrisphaera sp. INWT6 TaxID=2596917 RepID=UPI001891FAFD|nr:TadE/TadG family type IV pilus assembly protein [Quadrisphaera sp. INWT6]MBF5081379.1 pilus assembly protein [Quadrisphaera sp. INWT6]
MPRGDAGAAVVESTMVMVLVSVLFAGLLQLGLALHLRGTLVDCVGEGARFGALADRTPADGAARARELIEGSLPDAYAADVTASEVRSGGLDVVEVTAVVPLPLVGWFGGGSMAVRGHGLVEVLP